jgi:hypothetical protein
MRRFEDFCNARFHIVGDRFSTPEEWLSGRIPLTTLVHGDTSSDIDLPEVDLTPW